MYFTDTLHLEDCLHAQAHFFSKWDIIPYNDAVQISVEEINSQEETSVYSADSQNAFDKKTGYIDRAVYQNFQKQWRRQTVNLDAFLGKAVRLKWLFYSDNTYGAGGFYIDDLAIECIKNIAPLAADDTVYTALNTPTYLQIATNDFDPEAQALSVEVITAPDYGTLSGGGNLYFYMPAPDFVGIDTWQYLLSDPHCGADTATVWIMVGEAQMWPAPPPPAYETNSIINSSPDSTDTAVAPEVTSSIKIYPNPNKGVFWIANSNDNAYLQLVNALGKTLWQQSLTGGVQCVDISMLETGIYIARINAENINYICKVLVIK